MTTVAVCIPTCMKWDTARAKSVQRIRRVFPEAKLFAEDGPTPNYVWADKLETWAAEQDCTHVLQVQDDAILCPEFEPTLFAMLDAVPDQIISLFTIHPVAKYLVRDDKNWMTTTDLMTGVANARPIGIQREYVRWRATALEDGALRAINEDTLLGLFCAAEGHRIWNPVPAVVDHDTTVPSNYGNARAVHNRASVNWNDHPLPSSWKPRTMVHAGSGVNDVPHLGRYYPFTPYSYLRWVKSPDKSVADRLERDVVRVEVREDAEGTKT